MTLRNEKHPHASRTATILFRGDEAQVRLVCDVCGITWFARLLPAVSITESGVRP